MPFWQIFGKGRDGCALLVRPSRIPHWISKILFVLGSYEFLVMQKGKIRKGPFRVQSGKITVCTDSGIRNKNAAKFFDMGENGLLKSGSEQKNRLN